VAVAAKGAKVGMMLYEVRRAAEAVAAALRDESVDAVEADVPSQPQAETYAAPTYSEPAVSYAEPAYAEPVPSYAEPVATYADPAPSYAEPAASYAQPASDGSAWPSYLPNGNAGAEPTTWS
jgi:hypothetical protein